MLNCSTDGDPPVALPCLCCFYPLFDTGAVQQYLLTLEVIPTTTVRLTSEALGQQAANEAASSQLHCAPSLSGSMNSGSSGDTLGACSSGSGVTDQASGSSGSPTEMDIVAPAATSRHRHHSARHHHHEKKVDGNIVHKAKSSLSLFSNAASLTSNATTNTSTTDLQASELDNSSSLFDGESAVASEDRWIRDFTKTRDPQDQVSCGSHSLNPSVSGRSSHKLNRHDLQEPASGANKSTWLVPLVLFYFPLLYANNALNIDVIIAWEETITRTLPQR